MASDREGQLKGMRVDNKSKLFEPRRVALIAQADLSLERAL